MENKKVSYKVRATNDRFSPRDGKGGSMGRQGKVGERRSGEEMNSLYYEQNEIKLR